MNVVTLCTLLAALLNEIKETRDKLSEVIAALNEMVANPGDMNMAQNFRQARQGMNAFLSSAPSNTFSRMQRLIMEQIGVAEYLGESIKAKALQSIQGNGIDTASAVADLQGFHDHIASLDTATSNMLQGLAVFNIQPDTLNVGESVFTFVVPGEVTKGDMLKLGNEMKDMEQIIGNLSERLTGKRKDGYKIRAIGSGSCVISVLIDQIILANGLFTLILIALKCYKKLLEIKQLRQQVGETQALRRADEVLKILDDEAKSIVDNEIEAAVDEFVKDQKLLMQSGAKSPARKKKGGARVSSVDSGRENELKIELRRGFKSILKKMEKGFIFDMDSGKPESPEEGEEKGKLPNAAKIAEIGNKISQFREEAKMLGDQKTGIPLLSLEEDAEDGKEE